MAAAVALGVSELAAGLLGLPSLIEGMGNWVIDVVPTPLKEWAIATFGTNDKLVLLIGIVVVTILLGALVGVLARDRFGIATAVFIGFAAVASLAALNDPSVSLGVAVIPAGLAAITGLVTLQWLYGLSAEPARTPAESDEPGGRVATWLRHRLGCSLRGGSPLRWYRACPGQSSDAIGRRAAPTSPFPPPPRLCPRSRKPPSSGSRASAP